MKAIRASLTFFYDENRIEEQEIKSRLAKLVEDRFRDVRDRDLRWQDGAAQGRPQDDLAEKLQALDT